MTPHHHAHPATDVIAENSPLCLIGMGYVGLPLALRFVEAGFDVWGIEKQENVLRDLLDGRSHVHEPGLPAHLAAALRSGRFHLTANIPADVDFRAFVISVGTPLKEDGSVSFAAIESTTRQIGEVAKPGALVMLRSTVAVGTTRQIVRPMLDNGIELAFCPERTLQGRALDELRTLPQIVAGETAHARMRASRLFHTVAPCVVEVSSLETAEVVKLTANTFRDVTFAFANEAARLCDAVGVSALEVVQAGGMGYPRSTMPRPGPVGGSCLTKDPAILMSSFRSYGLPAPAVVSAARSANENVPVRAARQIRQALADNGLTGTPTTAVLGVAFKGWPETGDIRGSQAVELVRALQEAEPLMDVRSHDLITTLSDHEALGYDRRSSVEDAVDGAHVVVLGNDHPSYRSLDLASLVAKMATPAVVYDLWGLHKDHVIGLPEGVTYFAPGEAVVAQPAAAHRRTTSIPVQAAGSVLPARPGKRVA